MYGGVSRLMGRYTPKRPRRLVAKQRCGEVWWETRSNKQETSTDTEKEGLMDWIRRPVWRDDATP